MSSPLSPATVEKLHRCVLFHSLDDKQFANILSNTHELLLQEGETLFQQGQKLTDIYLLISGGIKLFRLTPNGDEKIIEIIRPGQTFAEAALFMGAQGYPVYSVALTDSLLVGVNAATYRTMLDSSTTLCLDLLARISQRLHQLVNEVDHLTLHNATYRVVNYLLSERAEETAGPVRQVHLNAPKHVIASRLSIKPETFSRTLKKLVTEGLIEVHDAHIVLLDTKRLEEMIRLDSSV